MSLVSNYIGSIQSGTLKGQNAQSIDLSDNTFSNLLDKQMQTQENTNNFGLEFFAGLSDNGINIQDLITSVNRIKDYTSDTYQNRDIEIGTSEMAAFLTKPFNSHAELESNHGLMNFAKKQAANFYNKCASNVVTDLTEFVEDTLKLS